MMRDSQYDDIRRKIERRYKERMGLIIHFIAFAVSNVAFWCFWLLITPATAARLVNGVTETTRLSPGFPWPIFITLGWGVGIVAHFLTYYYRYGAGANQREEAIQREIEQELARREEAGYIEKPKNDQRMRLTEDGELEVVSDDDSGTFEKNKRR